MTEKLELKANFAVNKTFSPFYMGGPVCVDKNGKYIFSMCGDHAAVLSLATGLVENKLEHNGDDLSCLAVTPDGSNLVTATKSMLLKQWDWKEPKCLRTWKAIHTSSVLCMTFDATSTLLATSGSDGTVKIWDLVKQYCTHNFRDMPGVVSSIIFHPSELHLYCASDDYVIKCWDLASSKCVKKLESHVSAVTCLQFVADNYLVSSGRDSIINIWNLAENKLIKTIPVYETIEQFLILPGSSISESSSMPEFSFATFGNKGIVKKWNSRGKCIQNSSSGEDITEIFGYLKATFLPGNGDIFAVTSDHNMDFICTETLKTYKHYVGYIDEVLDVKYLGENDELLIVATNSPKLKVFTVETSSCQLLSGHTDTVLSIDVFRNRFIFGSCSKDQTVRLWKKDKNSLSVSSLCVAKGHTHSVQSIACCKLKMTFMVTGSEDHTLKVWGVSKNDLSNVSVEHTILAHTKDINSVAVSPNDKLIASGSQDKLAKLWDVQNGENLGTFRGHKRGIWCVQFSPMDQVLASSSADGTIKLWSLSDFSCLKTMEGHDCSVLKVIFMVKGTQLASCGSDGLFKLWTVKSSECIKTLDEHTDKIWTLANSSDEQFVATGSADSTILIWQDVTKQEREEVFTKQEDSILQYQEMQNLLQEKKFSKALSRAILLQHPFTALSVVREILWEDSGFEMLCDKIARMRLDQKHTLLNFVVTWNTNSRNCHEAQAVLNAVLSSTHPEEIENFPDAPTLVEALLPYTERHFQRMSRISQQATFIDYTWQLMRLSVTD